MLNEKLTAEETKQREKIANLGKIEALKNLNKSDPLKGLSSEPENTVTSPKHQETRFTMNKGGQMQPQARHHMQETLKVDELTAKLVEKFVWSETELRLYSLQTNKELDFHKKRYELILHIYSLFNECAQSYDDLQPKSEKLRMLLPLLDNVIFELEDAFPNIVTEAILPELKISYAEYYRKQIEQLC